MSNNRLIGICMLWAAALVMLVAAPQSEALSYIGSLQSTTGNYIFTQRTYNVYFYSGLAFSAGILDISVSVPLIYQSTPWISYSPTGMLPSGGPQNSYVGEWGMHGGMSGNWGMGGGMGGDREMQEGRLALTNTSDYNHTGIGDPLIHGEAHLTTEPDAFMAFSLTGDVKVPLANPNRGFGTGQWDFGTGLGLSKHLGNIFAFANATYWFLGDLPGLDFHNPLVYSLALGYPFRDGRNSLMVTYTGSTIIISGTTPPASIGLGINHNLRPGSSLNASVALGLTNTAPDFSLGVGWRFGL